MILILLVTPDSHPIFHKYLESNGKHSGSPRPHVRFPGGKLIITIVAQLNRPFSIPAGDKEDSLSDACANF